MKYILSLLVTFVVFVHAYPQKKKAIFVIVDGIPADVIEKLPTPALDSIAAVGGFAHAYVGGEKDAYSETPTISAVGYNTVLTGVWVNKHNVWDNDIAAPNYNYKTIFRFLKDADSSLKIGIFSSWLDNRTKLVHMPFDYSVDGLELDTVTYPHDREANYMQKIDEAITDSAAAAVRNAAPDLSWVYLEYTDDMGHAFGDSEKYYNAVRSMDKRIGKIWSAVQQRQNENNEEWLVVVTTDHGRDSLTGRGHGGQSRRERAGWIVTNAKKLNSRFTSGETSIADIMPTIATFLNISIPREDRMEIDGVAFTGQLAAANAKAFMQNGKIKVQWKALNKKGNAKIWLSTSNNYKTGGKDEYTLMATVPLGKQQALLQPQRKSPFYKIVVETPDSFLNYWIVSKDEKQK